MKFEKIKPGMTLYDVHSHRMGNTTMTTIGVWKIQVISVDAEKKTFLGSWNSNAPQTFHSWEISKLKDKEPLLVRGSFGSYRRPTREERKQMLAARTSSATG